MKHAHTTSKWKATIALAIAGTLLAGCGDSGPQAAPPQASSGVGQAAVTVPTSPDGLTVEQQNVRDRLLEDNKPGAIKHLYVVSPYSGQVILYSTVKGKVTSSGKRLSPYSVETAYDTDGYSNFAWRGGYTTEDGNVTTEVLQDDGTYGSSVPYIFWWDVNDVYHQHFFTGGQIVMIRSEPLPNTPEVILNLDAVESESD